MFHPVSSEVVYGLKRLPIALLQVKPTHDTEDPLLTSDVSCMFQGVDHSGMSTTRDDKQTFICLQSDSTVIHNIIGCPIFERKSGLLRFKIGDAGDLPQKQNGVTDAIGIFT